MSVFSSALVSWRIRSVVAFHLLRAWLRFGISFDSTRSLATMVRPLPPSASESGSALSRHRLLVVIPFRDQWPVTARCLASLKLGLGNRREVLVCLVDNNSGAHETLDGLAAISQRFPDLAFRLLRSLEPFNFSRLNNWAVHECADFNADFVLFLNNDTEVRTPAAFERMARCLAENRAVGALGCTLLYGSGTIQHLFAAPGMRIVAGHPCRGATWSDDCAWAKVPRIVPAVTGAALMVRAELFSKVGGFREQLAHSYQDVDLCLRLQREGLSNAVLSDVTLYHHEGTTRNFNDRPDEARLMVQYWGKELAANRDHVPGLSLWSERVGFDARMNLFPWEQVLHSPEPVHTPRGKIALVVQRCAPQINAGAERYVLLLGRALVAAGVSVDILTTQSASHRMWDNELPTFEELDGIRILRFPVRKGRSPWLQRLAKLGFLATRLLGAPVLRRWFSELFLRAQGPTAPGLQEFLKRNQEHYEAVVFKTYLYSTTVASLRVLHERTKSLLIVTGHDELTFYMDFVGDSLVKSKQLGFVSQAERELCYKFWSKATSKPFAILSPGVAIPSEVTKPKILPKLPERYFVVIGRMESGKNLEFIFAKTPNECRVVFVGSGQVRPPQGDSRFVDLGAVDDDVKWWVLSRAVALLNVSRLEAFSIVTVEALALNVPVLALAGCAPVEDLVRRFGGVCAGECEFAGWISKLWRGDQLPPEALPKAQHVRDEFSWARTAHGLLERIR